MKRGLVVAIAILGGGVAEGNGNDKGPTVPRAGWDALATQGNRTVLYATDATDDAKPPLVVETVDVAEKDGAKVAHVKVGDEERWFAIDDQGISEVKGDARTPLFRFGQASSKDKDGSFVKVSDDGTVCVGWANQDGDCEDVCFNTTCFAPDRGLVELDGNDAPGQNDFVADAPTCLPPVARIDRSAADATGLTVCAGARCRMFDPATGAWSDAGKAPGAVAPEPSAAPAFTTPVPPALGTADAGVLTPDGATAVIVTRDAKGHVLLTSFDAASGKVLAHAKLPPDALGASLWILGSLVEVISANCAGPCTRVDVYEPKKLKLRGTVGGPDHPIDASVPPVALGTLWAFADGFGQEVDLVDAKTGKVKKRVALKRVAPRGADGLEYVVSAYATGDVLTVLYAPQDQAASGLTAVVVSSKGKVLRSAALPVCRDPALAAGSDAVAP